MPRAELVTTHTRIGCAALVGTQIGLAFKSEGFQYGWFVCTVGSVLLNTLLMVIKSIEQLVRR